jgi:hypothetical protein
METLATISLVTNIVQFIDFSGKLISKSAQLYQSSEGALPENIDTETATNHLILLNNKLKDAATTTGDGTLESLCLSCSTAAVELLAALEKIKLKGKQQRWTTMSNALRAVLTKEKIEGLERRLSKFRVELDLHITVDLRWVPVSLRVGYANPNLLCREQVYRLKQEQSNHLQDLDLAAKNIMDAIVRQQDVLHAVQDTQITAMRTLHGEAVSKIADEHAITRREIINEIRVRIVSGLFIIF